MKEFISKIRINKMSLVWVAVAMGIGIVILGFVLPNWFYFNAPPAKYETSYGGQKVMYDVGLRHTDDNGRLESIIVKEYWTPSFFCWEIHNDKKFTISSPAYIRER